MKGRNLKTTVLGVLCAMVFVGVAIAAHWDYWWDHPCADDPANTFTCESGELPEQSFGPGPPVSCWCEGDWNNVDHWLSNPDGYPSDPSDVAMIKHSNSAYGYCEGGPDHGNPCLDNGDCADFGVCVIEDYLLIDLVTETIAGLDIKTQGTDAANDRLEIRFDTEGTCDTSGDPCHSDDDCPGEEICNKPSHTLTLNGLGIDATNGPVTLKVSGSATLQTQ